jgi:hypothetical protein
MLKDRFWLGWVIALVVISIVGCYGAYYYFLFTGFDSALDENGLLKGVRSGTFGDAFGALNALFSGLAFSGVLVTILLQRQDLKEGQVESSRQQIESQFYNMLRLQQEVVSGFDIHNRKQGIIIQGRDCFRTWYREMGSNYSMHLNLESSRRIGMSFAHVWDLHRGDMSIYFRSLYNIFKLVSSSEHVDKRWLGNVARSLISDFELVMIFYNCLSKQGLGFVKYSIEFKLFDNLDVSLLMNERDVLLMDKRAFGENLDALAMFAVAGAGAGAGGK